MNLVEDEPEAVALPKEDGDAALEAWKAGHLLADVAVSRRAERGRRFQACGRAQLRALKDGRAWPNADDSAELVPIPDASRMRRDASGCVGILNCGKFRRINSGQISAELEQNLANFDAHWQK